VAAEHNDTLALLLSVNVSSSTHIIPLGDPADIGDFELTDDFLAQVSQPKFLEQLSSEERVLLESAKVPNLGSACLPCYRVFQAQFGRQVRAVPTEENASSLLVLADQVVQRVPQAELVAIVQYLKRVNYTTAANFSDDQLLAIVHDIRNISRFLQNFSEDQILRVGGRRNGFFLKCSICGKIYETFS